jgi:fibronectin type 3 domain-containing protein
VPSTGSLAGSVATSAATVDLTATGTADWAHWPGYDHKSTGGSQLQTFTAIGGTVQTYTNDPRRLTWSDGTPAATGSSTSGVYINGINKGFRVIAPADTSTRTLKLYVGGWNSTGQLTAQLSDGSAVDYVDASRSGTGQYDAVYTLTYKAGAAGQSLKVQWVQASSTGNVTLQAAALVGGAAAPPAVPTNVAASNGTSTTAVNVSWSAAAGATGYIVYRSTAAGVQGAAIGTPTGTSFSDTTAVAGTTYFYGVVATGPGGTSALSAQDSGYRAFTPPATPTGVTASDGTSANSVNVTWNAVTGATSYTVYRSTTAGVHGSVVATPSGASFTDGTVTAGTTYWYAVSATGAGGTSAVSAQDSGFAQVITSALLAGSVVASTAPVNLTAAGTLDWAHWPGYDHKATGNAQIGNFTTIGGVAQAYGGDARTLSWSDGTPTASGSSAAGVQVAGPGTGFRIVVPAGTTTRTVQVYVGGNASTGRMTARLSDGSSPDYVDASLAGAGVFDGVYTIVYRAASAGETLELKWEQQSGSGYVSLQGAALARGALSGASVASTAAVNLTSVGTADWAHWPYYAHKAAGGAQISNFTAIGGTAATYQNDLRTLSWSDGAPIAAGTNPWGNYIAGLGNGFRITVPAGVGPRKLKLYVGGWNSSGRLVAKLSDGSAPDFVDASHSGGGQYDVVYTLVFSAGSAGQSLDVQWLQNGSTGNVTLQGAALQ